DAGLGEELQVVWELEPGATIQQHTARDRLARSRPDRHGFLAPNSVCNNRSARGIISEAARRVRIKRGADLSLRRTAFRPGSERMSKTGVTLSARVLPSQRHRSACAPAIICSRRPTVLLEPASRLVRALKKTGRRRIPLDMLRRYFAAACPELAE